MNKISVLMSVYKETVDVLNKAIRSILEQTYKDFEFIIILDNPDNTDAVSLINGYNDSRIKLFINEKNIGLVDSLNKGIALCSGEYIARMDADDISMPERLEKQLAFIISEDLDIVGTDIEIMYDENIQGKIISCPTELKIIKKAIVHDNCVKHPSWMVKKAVYEKLDGYRDIYTCEDYDFLLRAILNGYKLSNVPVVGLRYRQNISSISKSNRTYQQVAYEYLRKLYRKGIILSSSEINNYLNSDSAQSKRIKMERYISQRKNNDMRIIFNFGFYKMLYHKFMYRYYLKKDGR